jgi:hypothetical protein
VRFLPLHKLAPCLLVCRPLGCERGLHSFEPRSCVCPQRLQPSAVASTLHTRVVILYTENAQGA